jgi:hypothetical protein
MNEARYKTRESYFETVLSLGNLIYDEELCLLDYGFPNGLIDRHELLRAEQ